MWILVVEAVDDGGSGTAKASVMLGSNSSWLLEELDEDGECEEARGG